MCYPDPTVVVRIGCVTWPRARVHRKVTMPEPARCSYGGYMVIDPDSNCVVAGWNPDAFSLDLDAVEQLLTDR